MQPLQGIRVVDLTRVLSGPYCTMTLADLGAEVIKIESGTGDDTRHWGPPFVNGESTYFLSVNRSKKSLVLDLKSEAGKAKLWELIENADIVAENFRPGTLARLGFSWEEIHQRFPAVILVSLSGYGQTGPLATRPGYDLIAQGEGGLMGVTGEEGRPPAKAGFSIADIGTGMWGVIGVLAALRARDQNGQGDHVDVSLLETVLSWQTYLAEGALVTGDVPGPLGSAHPTIAPYQTFAASDGYFNLAVGNDSLWNRLCDLLDSVHEGERWYRDPRYARNPDRVRVRAALAQALNQIFAHRTRHEWLEQFQAAGIPAGSVNSIAESFENPHVQARGMVQYVEHPTVGRIPAVKIPIRFGTAETRVPGPPPVLGADPDAVFDEIQQKDDQ